MTARHHYLAVLLGVAAVASEPAWADDCSYNQQRLDEYKRMCKSIDGCRALETMKVIVAESCPQTNVYRNQTGWTSSPPARKPKASSQPKGGFIDLDDDEPTSSGSDDYYNPKSTTGKDCVRLQPLPTIDSRSTPPKCERYNEYNHCLDLKFRADLVNQCNAPMYVRWRWTSTKYKGWSGHTLKVGGSYKIGCEKHKDGCNGEVEYMWKPGRTSY